MEPKIIILDVGKQLDEFRKQYAEGSPYLYDRQATICKELTACAADRVAPYQRLLHYVGKVKHGQSHKMPSKQMEKFSMAVGNLGMEMIESMRRLGVKPAELEEPDSLPYHFHSARRNIVVLRHNRVHGEAA
jgi:hypothetical protein